MIYWHFKIFFISCFTQSILELFSGIGVSIGPLFGGFLFIHFGFRSPFLFIALVQMLLSAYQIWRLPNITCNIYIIIINPTFCNFNLIKLFIKIYLIYLGEKPTGSYSSF